jgi:hypothetical protein
VTDTWPQVQKRRALTSGGHSCSPGQSRAASRRAGHTRLVQARPGEPQLRAGVRAFLPDDDAHALRPGPQAGELGDPRAGPDLPVAVIGRGPRAVGQRGRRRRCRRSWETRRSRPAAFPAWPARPGILACHRRNRRGSGPSAARKQAAAPAVGARLDVVGGGVRPGIPPGRSKIASGSPDPSRTWTAMPVRRASPTERCWYSVLTQSPAPSQSPPPLGPSVGTRSPGTGAKGRDSHRLHPRVPLHRRTGQARHDARTPEPHASHDDLRTNPAWLRPDPHRLVGIVPGAMSTPGSPIPDS